MTPLLLVAWVVIGIVVFLLSPRLPAWLGFALPLGIMAYGLVEVARGGPEASEVALVLVFGALAALVWRRRHRGTGGEGQPSGP